MKNSNYQLSKLYSTRPYKSRTQRPCDFCRRRKSCCIIGEDNICLSCKKFNHNDCTFHEGPIKRVYKRKLTVPILPSQPLPGQLLSMGSIPEVVVTTPIPVTSNVIKSELNSFLEDKDSIRLPLLARGITLPLSPSSRVSVASPAPDIMIDRPVSSDYFPHNTLGQSLPESDASSNNYDLFFKSLSESHPAQYTKRLNSDLVILELQYHNNVSLLDIKEAVSLNTEILYNTDGISLREGVNMLNNSYNNYTSTAGKLDGSVSSDFSSPISNVSVNYAVLPIQEVDAKLFENIEMVDDNGYSLLADALS